MKQKTPGFETVYFAGVCNSCGEAYEAESATEDLGGINFKCKKMICQGRVTLKQANQRPPLPPQHQEKKTTRYC